MKKKKTHKKLPTWKIFILLLVLVGLIWYIAGIQPEETDSYKINSFIESIQEKEWDKTEIIIEDAILGGNELVRELSILLNYQEPDVRETATLALMSIGTQDAIGAIINKFGNTKDILTIDAISFEFGYLDNGDSAIVLVECLESAKSLSAACAETLIRISDSKSIQAIVDKIKELTPQGLKELNTEQMNTLKIYTEMLVQMENIAELKKMFSDSKDAEIIKMLTAQAQSN